MLSFCSKIKSLRKKLKKYNPNKLIMKKLLVLMLFILMHFSFSIAQHFSPVWSGNPNNAMNFYIGSATINGIDMVAGDEIGIFDGNDCVGVITLNGPVTNYVEVKASLSDPNPALTRDEFEKANQEKDISCNLNCSRQTGRF